MLHPALAPSQQLPTCSGRGWVLLLPHEGPTVAVQEQQLTAAIIDTETLQRGWSNPFLASLWFAATSFNKSIKNRNTVFVAISYRTKVTVAPPSLLWTQGSLVQTFIAASWSSYSWDLWARPSVVREVWTWHTPTQQFCHRNHKAASMMTKIRCWLFQQSPLLFVTTKFCCAVYLIPKKYLLHPLWQFISGATWFLCDRLSRVNVAIHLTPSFASLLVIQTLLLSSLTYITFSKGFPITEIHFCLENKNFSRRLDVLEAALYSLEDHAEGATASALLHQSKFPHPNPNFPVKPGSVKEEEPSCYMCTFGLTRFLWTEHTVWPRTLKFWSSVEVLQLWGCFEKLHVE